MHITINGESYKFDNALSVDELLRSFSIDNKTIAIEVNREIVPPSGFANAVVREGDVIEIINFIGGG